MPLLFLLASCAYPLGTRVPDSEFVQAAEGVLQSSEPDSETSGAEAACSFEDGYRDQCDERGSTGVAAESMTSVLESMAALCGADGTEQASEQQPPGPLNPDEVRAPVQF